MALIPHSRAYDLVVLGASGLTGRLTAKHVAAHFPRSVKWAIAGRTESKLLAVAQECVELDPTIPRPSIEIVDTSNATEVLGLAKQTSVIVTTVGPFCKYGENTVKACAEAGTHYLDCTGEVPWVARMIRNYEAAARQSGAILIPQAGIQSAAADIATWAMARYLRRELDAQTKNVIFCVHKLNFHPSSGTLNSVLSTFDHFTSDEIRAAADQFASSPVPPPEAGRPRLTLLQKLFGVRRIANLGLVTTSPFEPADISVVERSWGLLFKTPTLESQFYGPSFRWVEVLKSKTWLHGVSSHLGLVLGQSLIGLLPPLRALAKRLLIKPEEQSPSGREAVEEEIEFRGLATPDAPAFPEKQAFCRAYFRGSMYDLTALFLAQAALAILESDVRLPGGFYTPSCLGESYLQNVNKAGFEIDVEMIG
ncbi:hypothetical protein CDD83_2805 [Cordyceps sp. RAO-2017]|nr:hypothetical protein CDD83_2805 [Cordyceps sp. RAO-2017]